VTLHRFFVDPGAVSGDRFPLPASIEHQVRTVLRLRDGERIVLLPGDGDELICRLEDGSCAVESRHPAGGEPAHRLTIIQALLKGDGLDEVVQRATELGAARFALTVTDRCVAREVSPRKLERLRTIARESAEQSERGIVPEVDAPVPLAALLQPPAVLLFERELDHRLRDLADAPTVVVIGPEGGFSEREVAMARERGVEVVGLGHRILRSSTVAPAVAAVVLSRTGDFA
jgi:16S rRNA (uracil1498-N3)-methyltransferase